MTTTLKMKGLSFLPAYKTFYMKKTIPFLLLLVSAVSSSAQRYLGVATSNWNALGSMYLNPANLGGCNEKLSVELFSFNLGVDNSLGTISSVSDISKTTNSNESGGKSIFTYGNKDRFSMMLPAVDMKLPSILYRINSRNTAALSFRFRAFNEFNNFSKTLYNSISDTAFANQSTIAANAQNFNWTAHLWSEVGLSYGCVAVDEDAFRLKTGITLRYLIGIGYIGIKGKNLDLSYTSGSDSFRATNTDIEYASNIQSIESGFSNGYTNNLFGGPSSGKGFGGDIGAILEYRSAKDKESDDYTVAFSAAVTDVGFISYKTSYNVTLSGNGYISGNDLSNNVKNYSDLRTYAASKGFFIDTGIKTTKVYLPTVIIIGADYKIRKHIYLNGMFQGNMASDSHFGSKLYSRFAVTPRFDSKVFTFGLPVTYDMLTHNMRLGLGIRLYGFYLGSDDMMALFSGGQYGINFYLGAMVPIYKKPKKTNNYFQ